MKCISNRNRGENCWSQIGIEYTVWDVFIYFYFLSLFIMQPTTENRWITKLATRKNTWSHEIPMRKKFAPKNYSRERNLDPRSTHEKKNWARKIPTRITFESTKYPREIIWTHEIPTRKILDPQFTHEKIVLIHEKSTKALWVIWVCLATNTLNDSINLTKHLKFVCRQKSTSSFMFSLRYCKDIENLFSWVL